MSDRVGDLLEEGEELLWSAPRWRGPLAYLRERWWLLLLAALLLTRTVARAFLAHQELVLAGKPAGALETVQEIMHGYGALDLALVLAALWFAYEVITLQRAHYFVTDRRIGLVFLGGAFSRQDRPPYDRQDGRWVVYDWGKEPGRLALFGEEDDEPRPWRLRFRIPKEDEPGLEAALEREPQPPPA